MLSKFTQVCYSHFIYSKKKIGSLKKCYIILKVNLFIYFLLRALLFQMVSWALSV